MIAQQLEELLDDVARHLAGRDSGSSSLLSLGTSLDTIGEINQQIAVCASFGSAVEVDVTARRRALDCLIRVVHLGGAEFYTAPRTAALFTQLMGEDK